MIKFHDSVPTTDFHPPKTLLCMQTRSEYCGLQSPNRDSTGMETRPKERMPREMGRVIAKAYHGDGWPIYGGVELDGVRHDAGDLSPIVLYCNRAQKTKGVFRNDVNGTGSEPGSRSSVRDRR